jgi:hypothetical protein
MTLPAIRARLVNGYPATLFGKPDQKRADIAYLLAVAQAAEALLKDDQAYWDDPAGVRAETVLDSMDVLRAALEAVE